MIGSTGSSFRNIAGVLAMASLELFVPQSCRNIAIHDPARNTRIVEVFAFQVLPID